MNDDDLWSAGCEELAGLFTPSELVRMVLAETNVTMHRKHEAAGDKTPEAEACLAESKRFLAEMNDRVRRKRLGTATPPSP